MGFPVFATYEMHEKSFTYEAALSTMKYGSLLEHNTIFSMGIKGEQTTFFWVNYLRNLRSVEGNYPKINLAHVYKLTSVLLQNKCHRCLYNK